MHGTLLEAPDHVAVIPESGDEHCATRNAVERQAGFMDIVNKNDTNLECVLLS